MKYILLLVALLSSKIFIGELQAQRLDADSLKKVLSTTENDTLLILTNLKLSHILYGTDPDESRKHAQNALILSEKTGNEKGILNGNKYVGISYHVQSNYDSASFYLNKAIVLSQKLHLPIETARILNILGLSDHRTGKPQEALEKFYTAINIADSLKSIPLNISISNNIALLYRQQGDIKKALEIYLKALEWPEEKIPIIGRGNLLNNIGIIYKDQQRDAEAIEVFTQAKAAYTEGRHRLGILSTLVNIGSLQTRKKEYTKSIQSNKQAIILARELNSPYNLTLAYMSLGKTFGEMGRYAEAKNSIKKALEIAQEKELLLQEMDAFKILYLLNKQQGLSSNALQYYEQYTLLKDSLYEKERSDKIAELNALYEVKAKNTENTLLKKEKELNENALQISEAKLQKQYTAIIASVIVVVLLAVLILLLTRNSYMKKEANKQLLEKQEEVQHHNEILSEINQKLSETNYEKESLMHVVIHDLRSPLNRIKALMDLLKLTGPLNEEQLQARQLTLDAVKNGSSLINSLLDIHDFEKEDLTLNLNTIDLKSFVQGLAEPFNQQASMKNISISLKSEGNVDIRTDADLFTRVVDNLISNAIKFSHPNSQINLSIKQADKKVVFTVKDQGPGFDEEDKKRVFRKFQKLSARPTGGESSTGLGLYIVHLLVKRLNGNISLESTRGEGTSFIITLPKNLNQETLTRAADPIENS
ncbi:tetratricopeptide repeat-containing sensor histidine kinase [Flammeovirgaceae bacterium SG7u.111]|nr:tetratricopeptide repeat-containing sensor histidine kinase [Flammeovirgaceae bacterium SG7u.132]WPO33968.1 tetratricopeptide repeat-containing sensor histidine kinase [Flammeovirgaceae bacterium SG7u.111]